MPDPELPDAEEEDDADEEEEDEEPSEADALDGTHSDAEVMLRFAIDLVSELVEKKRVKQTLLDALESSHEELIDAMSD